MSKKRITVRWVVRGVVITLLGSILGLLLYSMSQLTSSGLFCFEGLGCLKGPKTDLPARVLDEKDIPEWLKGPPRPRRKDGSVSDATVDTVR